MDTLTRDDLQALIEPRGGRCVSLYMPTFRKGTEQQQNVVRLNNLLRDAQRQLLAARVGPAEADTLLAPARRLATDEEFWRHPSDGGGGLCGYGLPSALPAAHPVRGNGRCRAPLRGEAPPAVGRRDGALLRAGARHGARPLFHGTAFGIHEVHVEGMPASLAEALNEEITGGTEIQSRGGAPRQRGEQGTAFYGHGSERTMRKDKLLRFFRIVDRCVHPLLRDQSAPLVLAGVAYLQPIYREANTCPHLAGRWGGRHPRRAGRRGAARPRVGHCGAPLPQAAERSAGPVQAVRAHGHASSSPQEVAQAARQGRVETLFVAIEGQAMGLPQYLERRTQLHLARETVTMNSSTWPPSLPSCTEAPSTRSAGESMPARSVGSGVAPVRAQELR